MTGEKNREDKEEAKEINTGRRRKDGGEKRKEEGKRAKSEMREILPFSVSKEKGAKEVEHTQT